MIVTCYFSGAGVATGTATALALRISLLFRLAALFLWITLFLASLSILDTTAGYLLNEEFSGDIMDEIEKEMIGIFKMLENDKTRQVALEQLKSLSKL